MKQNIELSSKVLTLEMCNKLLSIAQNATITGTSHTNMILRHIKMRHYFIFNDSMLPINATPVTVFARTILLYDFEDNTLFEIKGDLYEDNLKSLGITMPLLKISFVYCAKTQKTISVDMEKPKKIAIDTPN